MPEKGSGHKKSQKLSAAKPQPQGIHRRDAENWEVFRKRPWHSLRLCGEFSGCGWAAKKAEYAEKTFAEKQTGQ